MLGFPEAALVDMEHALVDAREIGHAATLMYALFHATLPHFWCENYATTNSIVDELVALADERGASFWKLQEGARSATRRSSTRGTPRALFGNIGLMVAHSPSESS
jgi:hypothetical protein